MRIAVSICALALLWGAALTGPAGDLHAQSRERTGSSTKKTAPRAKKTTTPAQKTPPKAKKPASTVKKTSPKGSKPSTRPSGNAARKKSDVRRGSSATPSTSSKRGTGERSTALPPAVRMKQEELASIRKEIREYEQRLASGRARERSTLERLDDMDRQTALIRTLLSQLNVQIVENEREILETIAQLNAAERELETLQGLYARSIISAYKRGRLHDTELLLSATSINLMFIRARYLKAFTIKQKAQAEAIRIKRESIASKKTVLEDKLQRQQTAVSERKQEETVLRQRSTEQKQLLDKVRQDNEKYLEQIRRKQAAANKIERLISDLIERERAKRAEAARKSRSSSGSGGTDRRDAGRADIADLPMRAISQTAFGRLKGRLPWPVAQGAVVGAFGEQLNKRLGTVTISNGIDIEVPAGSAVRSVADGVVSKIYFIPGYGNLVIVNHDDGFFTVYAHLSEIRVREDTRVKAGQVIATSGEGVIGPQIHFELWREKNKQNPLHWLAPR